MQLRMSPGGRISKSRLSRPDLPPSSVTVTTAAMSRLGPADVATSAAPTACCLSPESSVERPVPPPIETTRYGLCRFRSPGTKRVKLGIAHLLRISRKTTRFADEEL